MALASGTHLGPYEILSLIGVGGMGEVYKASDTRLNRTVAIKVLPSHFSGNPEMTQRFEREARMIAGLSHRNICTLYDVGHQDGIHFLVMEYLEGETVARRLERGALPLDEALKVATEIADALDMAHRQGVTHRDLKPSNVMLTRSGAKLLDFGLAKLKESPEPTNLSSLPTRADVTAKGTILGTLQYMAPEQLEGSEADARTDIFAFGAVLYEMVTCRKAFEGKSQASLISAIMSAEPQPLSKLQPVTPPALEHAVRTCLAKNADDRWQTAHDLMVQLKWIAGGGTQTGIPAPVGSLRRRRERLSWTLSAIATLLVIALAVPASLYFRGAPDPDEIRFLVAAPSAAYQNSLSISPDGRWIAFTEQTPVGTGALFVRQIGSTTLQQLAGTEGAAASFWSPDSRFIAFFAGGTLKTIAVSGGPPTNICEAPNPAGLAWNRDGIIVFSSANLLRRVSAEGGVSTPIATLDESGPETPRRYPYFLPDGRHFLYLAWSAQEANRVIYLGSLDSKETTRLTAATSMAVYADPGYLLYQRQGAVFAQSFNAKRFALTGDPLRIADQVYANPTGQAAFGASQNGVLIYRGGGGAAPTQRFIWYDRGGKPLQPAGEAGAYTTNFDLSLDGKQLALSIQDPTTGGSDTWLMEWARGVTTRFTYDGTGGPGRDVVWSPDGLLVAFSARKKGNVDIFEKKASGVGDEVPLVESPDDKWVEDWSRDGRYIVYDFGLSPTDLWALPLFGDRKPFLIVQSRFSKDEPHFSFDGKWLAYMSNESGRWQIYAISFPAADQKRQISTNGGSQPRWRRDGKELYYLALDGKLMAVDVSTGAGIDSGIPRVLFDTGLNVDPPRDQYAVTPDGQRFLLLKPVAEGSPTPITVVVNWTAALKK